MSSSAPSPTTPSNEILTFLRPNYAIFLISVAGLFLEMALIRWISTEIRLFAYLQNTVLVVCFLGLGMGCFVCKKPFSIRQMLMPLFVLVLLLAIPDVRNALGIVGTWLSLIGDMVVWYQATTTSPLETIIKVILGLALAFGLMVLLWEIFVPMGQILGGLLNDHPHTIQAYSITVAGSLVGILLFAIASAFYLPPGAWLAIFCILIVPFLGVVKDRLLDLTLLVVITACGFLNSYDPSVIQLVWSGYQRLALSVNDENSDMPGQYMIRVNNAAFQGMIDLSPKAMTGYTKVSAEERKFGQYDLPFLFQPKPKSVLIVGAGSGNDVAGALRGSAQSVTAVEIDPATVAMGRQYHPEQPYADSRVRVVIDDARSHFATTQEKYDLIIFGLLDSHTTTSMTNARLDHYVYTLESIRHAKSLLTPNGIVVLSFEAKKHFIAERMSRVLEQVFGEQPLEFRVPQNQIGWGGVLFVVGNQPDAIKEVLSQNHELDRQIRVWQETFGVSQPSDILITTDDWPYVYLERPSIPLLYGVLTLLLVALGRYAVYRLDTPALMPTRWDTSLWHFFFMGAAFLLLEVQNISKAAVVLGNTWQVNGVIISGILGMILLSNFVASKFPKLPMPLVGVGLIGSCLLLYFFDLSTLAFLSYPTKAFLIGVLTTIPMFFSGILFIRSFQATPNKDTALGANLFGSLVGGLLQSVTFITGIKALLLIVAGLYLAALFLRPKDEATATN
jgi:spermidine synthase